MTNNWEALHNCGGMDISNYETCSISRFMSGNFVLSYSIKKCNGFFFWSLNKILIFKQENHSNQQCKACNQPCAATIETAHETQPVMHCSSSKHIQKHERRYQLQRRISYAHKQPSTNKTLTTVPTAQTLKFWFTTLTKHDDCSRKALNVYDTKFHPLSHPVWPYTCLCIERLTVRTPWQLHHAL